MYIFYASFSFTIYTEMPSFGIQDIFVCFWMNRFPSYYLTCISVDTPFLSQSSLLCMFIFLKIGFLCKTLTACHMVLVLDGNSEHAAHA